MHRLVPVAARTIPREVLEIKGRVGTLAHEEIRRILTEGDRPRLDEGRVVVSLGEWEPATEHVYADPRDFAVFRAAGLVWHARGKESSP